LEQSVEKFKHESTLGNSGRFVEKASVMQIEKKKRHAS